MATHARGLTPEQRRVFAERGLVRVPGSIPRAHVEAMADVLWSQLARRHGIRRREPRTWRTERPADFKALQAAGAFERMASPRRRGPRRPPRPRTLGTPSYWGHLLVCFPRWGGRWEVPHRSWHLDLPADPGGAKVARLFAVLAPLAARGGGTVIATGSHRIVDALVAERGFEHSFGDVRKRLKTSYRWFHDLMSSGRERDHAARFMAAPTDVGGVRVQVEEMTGEPGDVIVMHPASLHAAAPNVLEAPRLALAQLVVAQG